MCTHSTLLHIYVHTQHNVIYMCTHQHNVIYVHTYHNVICMYTRSTMLYICAHKAHCIFSIDQVIHVVFQHCFNHDYVMYIIWKCLENLILSVDRFLVQMPIGEQMTSEFCERMFVHKYCIACHVTLLSFVNKFDACQSFRKFHNIVGTYL